MKQKQTTGQNTKAQTLDFRPFCVGQRTITAYLAERVIETLEAAAHDYLSGKCKMNPIEAARRSYSLTSEQIVSILAVELGAQQRRWARFQQAQAWAADAHREAWRGVAA